MKPVASWRSEAILLSRISTRERPKSGIIEQWRAPVPVGETPQSQHSLHPNRYGSSSKGSESSRLLVFRTTFSGFVRDSEHCTNANPQTHAKSSSSQAPARAAWQVCRRRPRWPAASARSKRLCGPFGTLTGDACESSDPEAVSVDWAGCIKRLVIDGLQGTENSRLESLELARIKACALIRACETRDCRLGSQRPKLATSHSMVAGSNEEQYHNGDRNQCNGGVKQNHLRSCGTSGTPYSPIS
jgi:hypothetical protein